MIRGGNGVADGPVDDAKFREVMEAVKSRGFGNKEEENARCITFYPVNCFISFLLTFPLHDWVCILYQDD